MQQPSPMELIVFMIVIVCALFQIYLIIRCILHIITRGHNDSYDSNDSKQVLHIEELNQIRLIRFGDDFSHEMVEKICCSICLDDFTTEDRIRLFPGCNHMFHSSCIDTWLLKHATVCPNCRLDSRTAIHEMDISDIDIV